ncbi:MAG: hypothetical protein AB7K41_14455 [Bdellovibrionales bacterium]
MTDTNTSRPATEIVGKLSVLSLGVPQAALADENVNKATMGVIIGKATGIVRRQKKNEMTGLSENLRGLRGSFLARPADAKRPEKRSSVLYLPEGLGGGMIDAFDAADKDGEIISANIALECFVERAKNPAGYSWGGRSLLPETEQSIQSDPVAEVMALAGMGRAPAIEDKSGEPVAAPAEGAASEPVAAPASEPAKAKAK